MPNAKYKPEYPVKAFELFAQGVSVAAVAKRLGVRRVTLNNWVRSRPEMKYAKKRGLAVSKERMSRPLQDYILSNMTEERKAIWDKLNEPGSGNSPFARVQDLFADDTGDKNRKYLYAHAFATCGFSASQACKKLGISKLTLHRWTRTDPEFVQWMDEVNWHKKNFVEDALFGKVEEGDTKAIIYANKSINRDRGYGDKLEVEMTGKVEHTLTLEDLELPLEIRRVILKAIEAREQQLEQRTIDGQSGKFKLLSSDTEKRSPLLDTA